MDALGFHLLLGAALIYDIPTITIHAELRAQSPADFLEALTAITSWPVGEPEWRIGYRLVAAALIFAPVLLTGAKVLHRPPPRSDPQWTLLGLAGWIELQLIAAAYGRGLNALASRYLDIFLVGIVLNAACLFHLIAALPGRPTRCLAGLWLLAVLTSASQKPLQFAEQRLAIRRDTAAIQTENLKRFLATGDRSALEGKPIPYPSPDRLIAITSDPAIRAILPPHLLGQTGRGRTRDRILRYGPLLIPFGVMLFMLAMLAARPTRAADET